MNGYRRNMQITHFSKKINMNLSVIIPIYNVEQYLDACIKSLYKQSLCLDEFEVILINDGSTDRSLLRAKFWADRYSNIKLIDQDNCGLSVARNRGVSNATGDYVFFLDSDDFLYPNTLSLLIDKAKNNDLDLLRFEYCAVNENDEKLYYSAGVSKRKRFAEQVDDGYFLFEKIYNQEFFACLSLIKRQFLQNFNIHFVEGIFFEDIEYAIKISIVAKRTMYTPIYAYAYRQRPTSILHTFDMKKAEDVISIVCRMQQYLKDQSLSRAFKNIIKQNNTRLIVSVLLRVSETLNSNRQHFFDLMKKKNISYLYPVYTMRDFTISLLYNLFGKKVVILLDPITRLRMALLRLRI